MKLLKEYIWPPNSVYSKGPSQKMILSFYNFFWHQRELPAFTIFQIRLFTVKDIRTVWSNLRAFSQKVQKTAKLVSRAITMIFSCQGFSLFAKKFNFSCPMRTAYSPAGSQECFTSHLSNLKDVPGTEEANQERCYVIINLSWHSTVPLAWTP